MPDLNSVLGSGRVLLILKPVDGRLGLPGLYTMLIDANERYGNFGFTWDGKEEVWIVFANETRTKIRVLHADRWGQDLLTRMNYSGRFAKFLDRTAAQGWRQIDRASLRRLILDGTLEGEWRNVTLQNALTQS